MEPNRKRERGAAGSLGNFRMIHHIELGADPADRSRKVRALIERGEITLGGYWPKKIYGTLSCRAGKRMKVEHRVFFKDEDEALREGYRPCGHCLPESYKRWKSAPRRDSTLDIT